MPLDPSLDEPPAAVPVASLHTVLQALADPVRLEMVRRLAAEGDGPIRCSALYDGVMHHTLRRDELEAALPGVVASIVDALD